VSRSATAAGQTVLAIHPGALGDVILFGHLLVRLGGLATLVARGETARLLAGAGVVARAIDFDALPMHEAFADAPAGEGPLADLLGRHDRLVSCFAADTPAARRLTQISGAARADFLPVRPADDFPGHLLDLWAERLGLGAFDVGSVRAWAVPRAWREAAAEALRGAGVAAGRPYVVFHPGAGSPRKCWPLERFEAVAGRLGPAAVFVLGPVELEAWDPPAVEALRRRRAAMRCPPLTALAGVLAGAAAYVGNDSGVTHVAAAVGAPTVAVFGASRADHFAPAGPRVRVVEGGNVDAVGVGAVASALAEAAAAGGRSNTSPERT
jgi:hypothetical protein